MAARQCAKRHWLQLNEPELATPFTEAELDRMAQGEQVATLARQRFPDGVLITSKSSHDALSETRAAIDAGATTIFEAAIAVDDLLARIDVMQRVGRRGRWKITEVKSSLEVKMDRHLPDLAFQVHVAQTAGLNVVDASVLTLNREYRCGDDLSTLFVETPVWKFLRKPLRELPDVVANARAVTELPQISIGRHCRSPYECPYIAHCSRDLHRFHYSRLPRLKKEQEGLFRDSDVETFEALPDGFDASALQMRFVRGELADETFVAPSLAATLDALAYPIVFIDFEAVQPTMPLIPETGPYERIPFQWSAHRLDSLDVQWHHDEFLADPVGDPRPEFMRTLLESTRDAATIMFYSTYEPESVAMLARSGIEGAAEMSDRLSHRGADLLQLVRDNLYLPAFRGRYGIKTVLPALVPGFDYSDLPIQGGDHAQLTFWRMMTGEHPDPVSARSALLRYCERDTEAMVRVFLAMQKLACSPAR